MHWYWYLCVHWFDLYGRKLTTVGTYIVFFKARYLCHDKTWNLAHIYVKQHLCFEIALGNSFLSCDRIKPNFQRRMHPKCLRSTYTRTKQCFISFQEIFRQIKVMLKEMNYHLNCSFLARLAKGQVSYCHHFSSVVCRPSSVRQHFTF